MISFAYAQAAPGAPDIAMQLLPFILIFAVMYFLIIRPQQKRMKQHKDMVENIRKGDTVVTAGGLIGKVYKVEEKELLVDFSETSRVRVIKQTIAEVRAKGEPVKE